MFFARTLVDLHNIRRSVERIGDVSDNIVRLGPVKLGLEAALELVPFVGEVYSLAAGAVLVMQGLRARVPLTTVLSVTGLVGLRTVINTSNLLGPIGLIGELVAAAFRAHKISADMIVKAMDETLYLEGGRDNPANAEVMARVRSGEERRRIVYL